MSNLITCKNKSKEIVQKWDSGITRLMIINKEYHIYYHENGVKGAEGIIRNGLKEEIWIGYYENGNIHIKSEYENGEKINREEIFDKKGNLRETFILNPDKEIKEYKTYYIDSSLRSEGQYRKNIKTGLWLFFNKSGKLVKKEKYNNKGKLIECIENEKLK